MKSFNLKSNQNNPYFAELKAIYLSERALSASLPQKIKNAPTDELALALTNHLQFTIQHLKRLEDIFINIGEARISNYNSVDFQFD